MKIEARLTEENEKLREFIVNIEVNFVVSSLEFYENFSESNGIKNQELLPAILLYVIKFALIFFGFASKNSVIKKNRILVSSCKPFLFISKNVINIKKY